MPNIFAPDDLSVNELRFWTWLLASIVLGGITIVAAMLMLGH